MNKKATPIAPRIINVYDIADFKSVSQITGYTILNRIKAYHKKEKHQVVLNLEAAAYFGISVEHFESIISNS